MKLGNYTNNFDAWEEWPLIPKWHGITLAHVYLSQEMIEVALLGFGFNVEFYNTLKRAKRLEEMSSRYGVKEVDD